MNGGLQESEELEDVSQEYTSAVYGVKTEEYTVPSCLFFILKHVKGTVMSKGNKKDFKVSAEHPVEETAGEKWKRENKAGLEAIKKYVEKHGTLTHPPRKL